MGDGLDLGGRSDGLIGGETALGIHQVGGEDGVDEGGFPQSGLSCREEISPTCSPIHDSIRSSTIHTDTHDIELETALEQLALDLGSDAVEPHMTAREDSGGKNGVSSCSHDDDDDEGEREREEKREEEEEGFPFWISLSFSGGKK